MRDTFQRRISGDNLNSTAILGDAWEGEDRVCVEKGLLYICARLVELLRVNVVGRGGGMRLGLVGRLAEGGEEVENEGCVLAENFGRQPEQHRNLGRRPGG